MATLNDILDSLGDAVAESVKQEFKDLMAQARTDEDEFAKETAKKLKDWLEMRLAGRLDDAELKALLNARKRVVRQHLNTLEIQTRRRLERIVFGIIEIALKKFVGKIS